MDNKKFEMLINLIDELDDFEITSIENLQKAREREKLYDDMRRKMVNKLFDFEYKECECKVHFSVSKSYQMIHAVLKLLKNNNEQITLTELSKICKCSLSDIYNFFNFSKYNCSNFENHIIAPPFAKHKKEEKCRNMEHVLNIAKQYKGGITLSALTEKSGLSYATVSKFARENKEIAEHIKYLN